MSEKVIIRRCDGYDDIEKIDRIIHEGLRAFGLKPAGQVLVKPNTVFAHRRYGRYPYTQPAVIEGLFRTLRRYNDVGPLLLGERTAVTVPTRYAFREAGYLPLAKRYGVRPVYFDEERKEEVHLSKGTVHRSLRFAKSILHSDFKIWVPKLKNHVSTQITCSLKLNIGICDSAERLHHHDYLLEEKIADLLEVGNPDFIVVDAILGGQKNELVPEPVAIGAIVMGTNAVAVDAVCSRILGLDPRDVPHIRIAHERGWGPIDAEAIVVDTDIAFEELRSRTKQLDRSFNDLRTMDLPVKLHLGNHPNGTKPCHTGCINMLKAVFAILDANDPGCLQKIEPYTIVVGEVDGDVDGGDGKVVLVGDCTKVSGTIKGKVKRVRGCPVPVPIFTLYACRFGRVKSPYLDLKAMWGIPYYSVAQIAGKILNRTFPAR